MEAQILRILSENARMSFEEIAVRVGSTADEVKRIVDDLERRQVIHGYVAVIDENALPESKVRALIEVRVTPRRDGGYNDVASRLARFDEVIRLYLVSGSYDLLLEVEGKSLQEVAAFVSEKLSTIDGVISCATSFQLKKYKESGRLMLEDEEYERLKVCP